MINHDHYGIGITACIFMVLTTRNWSNYHWATMNAWNPSYHTQCNFLSPSKQSPCKLNSLILATLILLETCLNYSFRIVPSSFTVFKVKLNTDATPKHQHTFFNAMCFVWTLAIIDTGKSCINHHTLTTMWTCYRVIAQLVYSLKFI
jgi:hypothetical protein